MASLAPSAEDGSSGLIRIEGKLCILAGAKPSAFPPANQRVPGAATPAFDGDVQAFVEAGNDESQLYNLAKKCGQCGKVCAVSMAACNGCGATLTGVVESRTNNIFMGFIHGVARGPFPFKVRPAGSNLRPGWRAALRSALGGRFHRFSAAAGEPSPRDHERHGFR